MHACRPLGFFRSFRAAFLALKYRLLGIDESLACQCLLALVCRRICSIGAFVNTLRAVEMYQQKLRPENKKHHLFLFYNFAWLFEVIRSHSKSFETMKNPTPAVVAGSTSKPPFRSRELLLTCLLLRPPGETQTFGLQHHQLRSTVRHCIGILICRILGQRKILNQRAKVQVLHHRQAELKLRSRNSQSIAWTKNNF